MSLPSNNSQKGPVCVVSLIEHLRAAASAFEVGKPLGPYLVASLLEDVDLCPALQQPVSKDAYAELHEAVERAKKSVQVAVACPSADRDWAVNELRAAVAHAQGCLEKWQEETLRKEKNSSGDAFNNELKRIGMSRCPSCAFAGKSLRF